MATNPKPTNRETWWTEGGGGGSQYEKLKNQYGRQEKWGVQGERAIRGAEYSWEAAVNPSKHLVPSSLATAMGKSKVTSLLAKSAAEAIGFDYDVNPFTKGGYGKNYGFLGAGHFVNAHQLATSGAGGMAIAGKIASGGFATVFGIWSIADTASLVSQGYQDNGLMGAAGGFGEAVAWQIAGRRLLLPALQSIGGVVLGGAKAGWALGTAAGGAGTALGYAGGGALGVGMGIGATLINPLTIAMAAGAYGYYRFAEFSQHTDRAIARQKQLGSLELGAPIQDQFGTISTLRQRSLQAIQNTHVNGRMAFGNEAALLHSTF